MLAQANPSEVTPLTGCKKTILNTHIGRGAGSHDRACHVYTERVEDNDRVCTMAGPAWERPTKRHFGCRGHLGSAYQCLFVWTPPIYRVWPAQIYYVCRMVMSVPTL